MGITVPVPNWSVLEKFRRMKGIAGKSRTDHVFYVVILR
jgi:hypothetical protein